MQTVLVGTLSFASALAGANRERFLSEFHMPLGLLSVAAVLEARGVAVTIVDPNLIAWEEHIENADEVRERVLERIDEAAPDWVGFTSLCDSYHHTLALSEEVGRRFGLPVILGGPQASAVARETLEAVPEINGILMGEAEGALVTLIEAMAGERPFAEVPNLAWRDTDGTVALPVKTLPLIEDLDSLPIPAFHHYAAQLKDVRFVSMEAGRGCPFKCDFCSTALFWQRRYRLKSGVRMLEEMERLGELFGKTPVVRFIHDMISVDKRALSAACIVLAEAAQTRQWTCSVRADCVTPDLLSTMCRAGCKSIYIGVESGSERVQKAMGKRLNLDRVFPCVDAAKALGMDVTLSFMAGFPQETLADLGLTLEIIVEANGRWQGGVATQMHVLAPYVGTELFQRYENQLEVDGYYSDQAGEMIAAPDLARIRAYPRLFSNFRYVPPRYYPRSLLMGIDSFVYAVTSEFPLTCALLSRYGVSALNQFQAWRYVMDIDFAPENLSIAALPTLHARQGFTQACDTLIATLDTKAKVMVEETCRYENAIGCVAVDKPLQADLQAPFPLKISVLSSRVDVDRLKHALAEKKTFADPTSTPAYWYVFEPLNIDSINVLSVPPLVGVVLEKLSYRRDCARTDELAVVAAVAKMFTGYGISEVEQACGEVFKMARERGWLISTAPAMSQIPGNGSAVAGIS
ncbi:MAG: B12-binding domain-containing radical SAM protein [Candidatus Thiodiazotropha sp. (ex Epidulcina cf. delphinae)]|nr:B12-binding domain-containing radical SAM protein [Candidatus Thiodiazotropha sp. (ex Epidulcina cf. delphinae)]